MREKEAKENGKEAFAAKKSLKKLEAEHEKHVKASEAEISKLKTEIKARPKPSPKRPATPVDTATLQELTDLQNRAS